MKFGKLLSIASDSIPGGGGAALLSYKSLKKKLKAIIEEETGAAFARISTDSRKTTAHTAADAGQVPGSDGQDPDSDSDTEELPATDAPDTDAPITADAARAPLGAAPHPPATAAAPPPTATAPAPGSGAGSEPGPRSGVAHGGTHGPQSPPLISSRAHLDFVHALGRDLARINDHFMEREEESVMRLHDLEQATSRLASLNSHQLQGLRTRLVDLHGELVLGLHWAALNYAAVLKIAKKYDKVAARAGRGLALPSGGLRAVMGTAALNQPFSCTHVLRALVTKAEQLAGQVAAEQAARRPQPSPSKTSHEVVQGVEPSTLGQRRAATSSGEVAPGHIGSGSGGARGGTVRQPHPSHRLLDANEVLNTPPPDGASPPQDDGEDSQGGTRGGSNDLPLPGPLAGQDEALPHSTSTSTGEGTTGGQLKGTSRCTVPMPAPALGAPPTALGGGGGGRAAGPQIAATGAAAPAAGGNAANPDPQHPQVEGGAQPAAPPTSRFAPLTNTNTNRPLGRGSLTTTAESGSGSGSASGTGACPLPPGPAALALAPAAAPGTGAAPGTAPGTGPGAGAGGAGGGAGSARVSLVGSNLLPPTVELPGGPYVSHVCRRTTTALQVWATLGATASTPSTVLMIPQDGRFPPPLPLVRPTQASNPSTNPPMPPPPLPAAWAQAALPTPGTPGTPGGDQQQHLSSRHKSEALVVVSQLLADHLNSPGRTPEHRTPPHRDVAVRSAAAPGPGGTKRKASLNSATSNGSDGSGGSGVREGKRVHVGHMHSHSE